MSGHSSVDSTEHLLAKRTPGGRIFELDALRGLAACIVLNYHIRHMFHMDDAVWYLRPFFDGHAAVVLFFALSGYVLSLSFWNGRQLPYGLYLVRRFFRIYVPFAAACLLTVLIARPLLNSNLPLTPWFYWTWHTPLTAKLILEELLFINQTPAINTAFWSLRYEVEMSLVFPALCALLYWLKPAKALLFGFSCLLLSIALLRTHSRFSGDISSIFLWSTSFIFGAIAAWQRKPLLNTLQHLNVWAKAALLAITLIAYYSGRDRYITLGAPILILFAQQKHAAYILRHRIPEYLGRISYSLYLVHGTVLFASVILLYGRLPTGLLIALVVLLSFAISHLFNVFIEDRADGIGRRLTRLSAHETISKKSSLA